MMAENILHEKWLKDFPEKEVVAWRDDWLVNGYCQKCRYCCGPQGNDDPFPMALLPGQIDSTTSDNFYMLNPFTPYLGAEGCKSLGKSGCKLPREKRPIACGLFPLVLVNCKLYLYKNCPAAWFTPLDEFKHLAQKAAAFLAKFSLEDLRRISISLPENTLAKKYIDLEMDICS